MVGHAEHVPPYMVYTRGKRCFL